MALLKLDFTKHKIAQDMIRLIEKEKGLPAPAVIDYSINLMIYDRIIKTRWGSAALPIWGHGAPKRRCLYLTDPHINVEIEEEKIHLVSEIAQKEDIDIETAVSYFLLFTMESLGYHI